LAATIALSTIFFTDAKYSPPQSTAAVFLGIGLLHLDEVSIGLAHRTIA